MREYSEAKKDFFGDSYIETRDESGRVVQIVKAKTDFFGDEYYETYDANMNRIGYSCLKKDFYGDPYLATYDNSGKLLRTSVEKKDFLGNKYLEIRNADGRTIGTSTRQTDFLGNAYTETRYTNAAGQGSGAVAAGGGSRTTTGGSGSHAGGGADIGAGLGCIIGFAFIFGIYWFFSTLHDYDGREKIHRFVMIMSFVVPLGAVLIGYFKLHGVGGFLRNRMLVISCGMIVVSQCYYAFYTSQRMEWILESDLAYYVLWLLPYTLFYGYSFLTAMFAKEALRSIPAGEIKTVLGLYDATQLCFGFFAALMMLRWEMYASKAVWGRTFFEVITIVVVICLGIAATAPGQLIVDKMTGRNKR